VIERKMKRERKVKPATMSASGARTGRDGAIDFVGKSGFKSGLLNQSAAADVDADIQAAADVDAHIYRVIELVGTSESSIEDAVNSAIERAHKTIRNLRWFEITRTSGHIEGGKARHFQVTLKVGFTMEEAL
jgi:flavin-binding protein dodecin